MRRFALALALTGCGSPFSVAASLAPDGSELAQADGAALDAGTGQDASGHDSGTPGTDSGTPDSGTDSGQEDSAAAEVSAGGSPGAGGSGTGGATDSGAAGGAPAGGSGAGGDPGSGGASGGAPGAGGSGTGGVTAAGGAGTGGSGPCVPSLCPAVLEDGSDCNSRCCTADGKCGCGGGMCAPVYECTRVLQSICSGLYAFKCPGVAPPSGCVPGTLNTGYPYFCCPKAVYP